MLPLCQVAYRSTKKHLADWAVKQESYEDNTDSCIRQCCLIHKNALHYLLTPDLNQSMILRTLPWVHYILISLETSINTQAFWVCFSRWASCSRHSASCTSGKRSGRGVLRRARHVLCDTGLEVKSSITAEQQALLPQRHLSNNKHSCKIARSRGDFAILLSSTSGITPVEQLKKVSEHNDSSLKCAPLLPFVIMKTLFWHVNNWVWEQKLAGKI